MANGIARRIKVNITKCSTCRSGGRSHRVRSPLLSVRCSQSRKLRQRWLQAGHPRRGLLQGPSPNPPALRGCCFQHSGPTAPLLHLAVAHTLLMAKMVMEGAAIRGGLMAQGECKYWGPWLLHIYRPASNLDCSKVAN